MKTNNRSLIFIIILLLAASFVSWNQYLRVYSQQDTADIHLFPKTIGGWISEEMTITEEEYAVLETKNAFARKYVHADGREVFVFIVYSQNNRKVSHPPEVCYMGSGIAVSKNGVASISIAEGDMPLSANKLMLERKRSQQVAFYWFKVGDSFTPSYWKQQFLIVMKSLLGQSSGSALIRLSSDVVAGDVERAEANIESFASEMVPHLPKFLP